MSENNDFGMKLKSYRKAREMSQADFAAFLGIPFRTYQNYESGHRYPRNMEVVNKIAVALGVTAEDLLGAAGGYIVEANEKGGSRDRRRMEQMVTQMAKENGVTEELKERDPMKWVGLMNTLKAQAEETILTELVFS